MAVTYTGATPNPAPPGGTVTLTGTASDCSDLVFLASVDQTPIPFSVSCTDGIWTATVSVPKCDELTDAAIVAAVKDSTKYIPISIPIDCPDLLREGKRKSTQARKPSDQSPSA